MSRFSRSEAPTTTSMLPASPKKTAALPLCTTFGPDADTPQHPVDQATSKPTSLDENVGKETEGETHAAKVTPSKTVCCRDKLDATETGSCVVDMSTTSTHAPQTLDDVTNMADTTGSVSAAAAAAADSGGDVLRSATSSARDGIGVTSSVT